MLALPASVPLVDPFAGLPGSAPMPSGPTIYLPPTWSLWPVQVAPEAGMTPEPAPFFAHDHVGWKLIPAEQRERARLALEVLADHVVNFLLGQEDKSSFTNAHNDLYFKVQRLVKTGDDKPRPRKQPTRGSQPVAVSQRAMEAQHLATVLFNLLGLEVAPSSGVHRSGDYRYKLYNTVERGDGMMIERLRPDRTDYLACLTPAFDKLGVEFAMMDLKRQYDEILTRTGRPRFAHSDQVIIPGQIIVERGPFPDLNAAGQQPGSSGKAADLIAQFNKDVYKAGETEFKRALGGLHVKQ